MAAGQNQKQQAPKQEPPKAPEQKPAAAARPLPLIAKLVEIRKRIPRIPKTNQSDGVKYAYININDIYEHLTPAMNDLGVMLLITSDDATRHNAEGDPVYWTTYTQRTRNGERLVFVWEEDLTLEWINVEDPADTLSITLHAVGTNDAGPDKAKGSALTYALKYYFFEIFGIDQGQDDPDNKDNTRPLEYGEASAGNNNQQQAAGSQPPKRLSEAQLSRMYRKGDDAGIVKEDVDGWILKKFNVSDPAAMSREQYDETCAALDRQAAAKRQQQQGGGQA